MPARISHVARSRAVASVRLLVCFASRYFTLMSCRKEHTAPRQWQLHRYAFLLRAIPCEQGRQFLFRAPRSSDSAILDGGRSRCRRRRLAAADRADSVVGGATVKSAYVIGYASLCRRE